MQVYKRMLMLLMTVCFVLPAFKTTAQSTELKLNGKHIYIKELNTGSCLYEKDAYVKTAMASTTKIMTAIIVLEKGNLSEVVKVSSNAASTDGSSMNLKANEEISINDLLYGLLIKSGNDAAVALAEAISGNVEEFAVLMNQKAKEIGAYDTNFTSPHGLDNDLHYTTAKDLAVIAEYAMKIDKFRQIVSTKSTSVNGHYLSNTNDILWSDDSVNGIKTGYTGNAGRCIVISFEKNGLNIIAVILGCETSEARTKDCNLILDYFPGNYSIKNLVEPGAVIDSIKCNKSKKSYIPVIIKNSVTVCIENKDINQIHFKSEFYENYKNGINEDIKAGTVLGIYYVYSGDKLLYTTELIASENNKRKNYIDYLSDFFTLWVKKTFTVLYI